MSHSYSYIKSRPLNKEEKRRLRISVATERRLTYPHQQPSKQRMVNSLVALLLESLIKIDINLINWLLSYGSPKLINNLIISLANVNTSEITLDVIKHANPDHVLKKEYITPDFQKIQTKTHPKTALVCFMGNGLRLNIPLQLFHFVAAKHFDVIFYLRDFEKQHFQNGILNIAQTRSQLNEYLRRQIPTDCQINVLGTSSGGYTAAQFSEHVYPSRLLMFSPPLKFKNIATINESTKMSPDDVRIFFSRFSRLDHKFASDWSRTDYATSMRWLDTDSHATLQYLLQCGQINSIFEWYRDRTEIPSLVFRSLTLIRLNFAILRLRQKLLRKWQ